MRKRSGFPTVAIGKFNGTNWGETKPNSALDVTAFEAEYDMTLTGGTTLNYDGRRYNNQNGQFYDIGWGDGSFDEDLEQLTSHPISATATGRIRVLGTTYTQVKFINRDYITNVTVLANFQLVASAFSSCNNMNFVSATLDNTYVGEALSVNSTFRFCTSLIQGLTRLKINFAGLTNPNGVYFLQGASNYPGEDWTGFGMNSPAASSWNRSCEGIEGSNLNITGWVMNCTDLSNGFRNANQNADWSGVFPTGHSCKIFSGAFDGNDQWTGTGLDTWDMSEVTNITGMLKSNNINVADISGWDVGNVITASNLFQTCIGPAIPWTTPIGNWSWNVSSKSTGTANGTVTNVLEDTTADFVADGVSTTNTYVKNLTTGHTAQVTGVATTQLILNADIFTSGDSYRVYLGISLTNFAKRSDRLTMDLSDWNMDNVISIGAFCEARSSAVCSLNFNLSNWERTTPGDTSTMANCRSFGQFMFGNAGTFEGGISQANLAGVQDWDVSGCTNFSSMFAECTAVENNFETVCDVSNWEIRGDKNVSLRGMFQTGPSCPAGFGSANWNTTNMQNVADNGLAYMFDRCLFANPDISNWDMSAKTELISLAVTTLINRDCSAWVLSSVTNMSSCLNTSTMSEANCAATLVGWEANTPNTGVTASSVFGTRDINETTYPAAKLAYDSLIAPVGSGGYGWVITGITWVT